jgi:CHAT domain-containing protein
LQLTRRALFAAQQAKAPESIYRWQWQTGRILSELDRTDEAISAYRLSASTLQSIRHEASRCYGRPFSSFRELAGPMFFELVDLLLQRAGTLKERDQQEPYLIEAREAVELLKVFELRDYFQDDCVDAARTRVLSLDEVSKTAIVIYVILLRDRTEILLTLPTGLKRQTVPVGAEAMAREVQDFRLKLEKRTTFEFLPHAQQLYDWLIRPIEQDLKGFPVDALVFVPDGCLRTIPLGALHDGERFLLSTYPVAVAPGISLTDPQPMEGEKLNVLVAGLTESVQGYPPLPFVSNELHAIERLYGGRQLVNEDFLVPNFQRVLKEKPFGIVHIASHGHFSANLEDTFVLTFEDKLTMDRLSQFVGLFRFREAPLELLTLSACETAAGDDRAALGLAGIAVRAGARSALATLWHINDPVSSRLVEAFYRGLQDSSLTRAAALQRAQLKIMKDPRYDHPGYWSPFILINNWL